MSPLLPTLSIAFSAFWIWLGLRIVNRRERWAKRTAIALAIPTIYLVTMGPILWMDLRHLTPAWAQDVPLYWPVQWALENGPEPIRTAIKDYLSLWR